MAIYQNQEFQEDQRNFFLHRKSRQGYIMTGTLFKMSIKKKQKKNCLNPHSIDCRWDCVHLQFISWRPGLVLLKNSGLLDKEWVCGQWNYGMVVGATDSGAPAECRYIVFIMTGTLIKMST